MQNNTFILVCGIGLLVVVMGAVFFEITLRMAAGKSLTRYRVRYLNGQKSKLVSHREVADRLAEVSGGSVLECSIKSDGTIMSEIPVS